MKLGVNKGGIPRYHTGTGPHTHHVDPFTDEEYIIPGDPTKNVPSTGGGGSTWDIPNWRRGDKVGQTLSGLPVYIWTDTNSIDGTTMFALDDQTPVPESAIQPIGGQTSPPRTVGGYSAPAPRLDDYDKPFQGSDGNWYTYRYPAGGGTPELVNLQGPPAGQESNWMEPVLEKRNGQTGVLNVRKDGRSATWVPVAGAPIEPQMSTRDPRWQTELPNGNLGIWDNQLGDFYDTGLPAPSGTPDTKTFPDGSLHQYDKVAKAWVEIAPAPPKDNTAKEIAMAQIAANQANNNARMAFDAAENAAHRKFQGEQAALQRKFEAEESEKGRRLTWELEQGRMRETHEDRRLRAAESFAQFVNSVDPAALPAFLAAGGGNLGGGNLVASVKAGANAITENALMPAARMLGTARKEFTPAPYPGATPAPPSAAAPPGEALGGGGGGVLGGGGRLPTDPLAGQRLPTVNPITGKRFAPGSAYWFRGAEGGVTRARQLMVGDAPGGNPFGGGARPEIINNRTGAPLEIIPSQELGQGGGLTMSGSPFAQLLQRLPRFHLGTQSHQHAGSGPLGRHPGPGVSSTTVGRDGKTYTWDGVSGGWTAEAESEPAPTSAPAPTTTQRVTHLSPRFRGLATTTTATRAPTATPAPPPTTTPPATGGGTAPAPGGYTGEYKDPVTGQGPTAEERGLMDDVRDIRSRVPQLEDADYIYRLDYFNQLPTFQKSYLLGLQAKHGIAAEDWEAEALRNRLSGRDRLGVSTRY